MCIGPDGRLHRFGLDYGAAESGLKLAGIAITPDLWAAVRVIEVGVLESLNEA